jgi:hypothetical protein
LSREKLVEIDFLAKRYGILPSEILKISIDDYQFNILAASTGVLDESRQAEKSRRGLKR